MVKNRGGNIYKYFVHSKSILQTGFFSHKIRPLSEITYSTINPLFFINQKPIDHICMVIRHTDKHLGLIMSLLLLSSVLGKANPPNIDRCATRSIIKDRGKEGLTGSLSCRKVAIKIETGGNIGVTLEWIISTDKAAKNQNKCNESARMSHLSRVDRIPNSQNNFDLNPVTLTYDLDPRDLDLWPMTLTFKFVWDMMVPNSVCQILSPYVQWFSLQVANRHTNIDERYRKYYLFRYALDVDVAYLPLYRTGSFSTVSL